jgi:tetraacyldisaccharide 4'-kinase
MRDPLSSIYEASVWARNRLYDRGIFKARRLAGPVISVGNISVGGSGKTPFVILLGELLKGSGIPFDVLSRGYGRATRGVLEVDPNGSPRDFGDEPILIARRLGVPVFVGEDRYRAGLLAGKKVGSQLHLLDDGFQHRALARDFDIVLLSPEDLQDKLLPTGRLREPVSSLHRANAIVVSTEFVLTEVLTEGTQSLMLPHKILWRTRRGISLANLPERPVVFCGIARPEKFVDQLRQAGAAPVATRFYPDHHAYTPADIRQLLELRKRNNAAGFITTEKDAINLGAHLSSLGTVAVATVTLELLNSADALDNILRAIDSRKPRA